MRYFLLALFSAGAALAAAPAYRIGPASDTGARWIAALDDSFMLFTPAPWQPQTGSWTMKIQTPEPAGAGLEIRRLNIPAGFDSTQVEQERLTQIKAGNPVEPLQEAKNSLSNGIAIRYFIYDDKIAGTFLHNVNAYEFMARPSPSADWNAVKNILATLSDINPDAFRQTPKPKPRRLASGQWVSDLDEEWMIKTTRDGWTAETPQGNDVLFLSGYFEGMVLNMTVGRILDPHISTREQFEQWNHALAAKTKAPVTMELGPQSNLEYLLSPDKTELLGLVHFGGQRYPVNMYGHPNIDFQETKRLLGSMAPLNRDLIQNSAPPPGSAPTAEELPAAPPVGPSAGAALPAPDLPAPDPRIKAVLDKYFPVVAAAALAGALIYALILWLNDKKLLALGRSLAAQEEGPSLELFTGGWYLTLFPTIMVFAPGGVRLAAIRRKPPLVQAFALFYIGRWVAIYYGMEKALGVLTAALFITAVLLGIALVWSFKGTPCWIYDDQGRLVFKIRRQLGLLAYRFIVIDPVNKEVLGYLRMSSLSNIIRKQWWILNKKGETVGHAIEDSLAKSILRRLIGHLWGLFRADFEISSQGQRIGQIKSARSPFNRQTLNVSCPPELDPRLLFACLVSINVFNRDRWYPFWSA